MWGGLCMFIVFQRRFVKVENLRGIPGEEAQLSTSTVTEETDTELGRLSTLTLNLESATNINFYKPVQSRSFAESFSASLVASLIAVRGYCHPCHYT